ncbi:MAG: hypothetical protein KC766_37255 [Myxococcales bacterium]|nr:hypothetical protein [Myxococcales bacterium]
MSTVAAAQSSAADKAAAEALFDKGKKQLKDGDLASACRSLEESQRLDPGVGTLLYLAECYEQAGKTASAWATFREAAAFATRSSDAKREKIARGRAERLEGVLAKLVIEVPPSVRVEGMVVTRDGDEVGSALWGTAVPVDPGTHTIRITAPSKVEYQAEVVVPKSGDVTFAVPPLERKPPEAEPEAQALAPATSAPAPAPTPLVADEGTLAEDGSGQRTLGIVVGVVGLLGVGAGTFFGLQASSKNSEADDNCRSSDSSQCNQKGVDLGQEAEDAATLSTIAFGVGALALAGGIVLYATAPSNDAAAGSARRRTARLRGTEVRLVPAATPSQAGVFVGGHF